MSWFNHKTKYRPTKVDILNTVEQHFSECMCEADTHTIHETVTVNGKSYVYTITRTVREDKH